MNYGAQPLKDEADFQARVGRLATTIHDLLHYHTHDSRRSSSGFPDSVFVGRRVLFRELKMTRRSKISQAQKDWIDRLRAAGADAAIWYAEDYHSGLVDEQLRDAAHRTEIRQVRRVYPPLEMRLAKRLYLKTTGGDPARSALLWEAGVASVEHGAWIARAHEILAIVAAELPEGEGEHTAWLRAHSITDGTVAAIFTALKTDLTTPADPSELLAEPHRR
ncbi:MAG: hypothetical protein ABWY93_22700 [Mycobacterium sp.]